MSDTQRHCIAAMIAILVVSLGMYLQGILALALCFLFVLPVIIRNAYFVCVWFIFFSYFRLHEAIPVLMAFKIPQLLALASLAGLGWQLWMMRGQLVWHQVHTMLCVFSFWVLISCFMATNKGLAFGSFNSTYIKIVIMVFAISWLPTNLNQLRQFPFWLLLCGILIAAIALDNKANGIGLVEGTRVTIGRNIGSMLGDPNDLALVLQFPVSFALAYCFSGSKFRRVLSAICFVILVLGVLATQSRGGLLGIAAGVFTMTLIRSKNLLLPGIMGVMSLGVLVVAAGISDRSSGGAAEEGVDASAMGRVYAWVAAFRMAVSNPFTGVGLNNFYVNYYFYSPHWDGKNHAVHSTWFQILGETGFAGLALFVLLLVSALRVSHQLLKRLKGHDLQPFSEGLWLGTISFCVGGTFLTQGFTWPLYILIGLLMALDRLTGEDEHVSRHTQKTPVP
ncbi:O-antigen ligase family protein [Thaumasiovibrio subtropicus]|uniref:O-antigen ligase family protein n=1 Tax=Thaumasiovibrio subtropicus TaxID=1891207 RepID=UPI000B34AFBB|nr:O-antigen ligase family protein [Thaumasiovibrio subtropicus]